MPGAVLLVTMPLGCGTFQIAMEKLTQIEPLLSLLKLLVWTGQLSDERPASALIVAPAGGGKTSSFEYVSCPQALFTGDLTARTMKDIFTEKNKDVTHLLLGDMLAMFGHKKSTVELTKQIVAKFTGEQIDQNPWTGEKMEPRSLGLITAIPDKDFPKYQKEIDKGGFGSRFLIAKFSYGASAQSKIHQHIASNSYAANKPAPPLFIKNPGKWEVRIPKPVAVKIQMLSFEIARDPLGFRAHRQIRALVKASARSKGRKSASMSDYHAVESLRNFFVGDGKQL